MAKWLAMGIAIPRRHPRRRSAFAGTIAYYKAAKRQTAYKETMAIAAAACQNIERFAANSPPIKQSQG
jgi:hypothetical protein